VEIPIGRKEKEELTAGGPVPLYIVDTSVALKWFVESDEADTRQASALRNSYFKDECDISAPELLVVELANALKAGRRFKASEIGVILESLREFGLRLQRLGWATLARAVEIASACGATVYDSYFLALALESEGTLVTADEAFVRKVRHFPGVILLRHFRLPGHTSAPE
jgi:predicted nucleic acid-binding protein